MSIEGEKYFRKSILSKINCERVEEKKKEVQTNAKEIDGNQR